MEAFFVIAFVNFTYKTMDYLIRIIGDLFERFLGKSINYLAIASQAFFYWIFKIGAIENPDVLKPKLSLNKIKFFLYTKHNVKNHIEVDFVHPEALNNPNVKIVFIIHGWMSSFHVDWYDQLKQSFLSRKTQEYYVVLVDWSKPAEEIYALASWYTKDVGEHIGQLIITLNKHYSIPLSHFLLVGHSLGAQVAGYVGKTVYSLTAQKLRRIVALDPAGPLFNTRPEFERLNKHDARVVHVIHTNGDVFGHKYEIDALNFFPNGGDFHRSKSKVALYLLRLITYSQEISPKLFARAIINPDKFMATKCNSWEDYLEGKCRNRVQVSMGDLEVDGRGKLYLEIKDG